MKQSEIIRIKEVGKKTVADFIRSETGSVGVKNAATIGVFAGVLAVSQSSIDAAEIRNPDGSTTTIVIAVSI